MFANRQSSQDHASPSWYETFYARLPPESVNSIFASNEEKDEIRMRSLCKFTSYCCTFLVSEMRVTKT